MKSYDLSTSSKWAALSDGEHTVQIVAKGTGYMDSAKSTSVTVTKGSTGETWVLNYQIEPGSQSYNFTEISFTSNNQNFDRLYYNRKAFDVGALFYFLSGTEKQVYSFNDYSDIWIDGEEYRTITFETAPTGDLLTWLEANGTKQGGATLISFTIEGTSYQAEEGMTWQQWVNSSYNSNNRFEIAEGADLVVDGTTGYTVADGSGEISGVDLIVAEMAYTIYHSGGSGN